MEIKNNKLFILLMTFAVGTMAANIYYAQPILKVLAGTLGIRPDAAGLIMTLTQIGYGLGVLFVVPLGDLISNKKLIQVMIAVTIVAEIALGFSHHFLSFSFALVLAGLGASTVQIIVPYVSHLYDSSQRGQVLGTLMSGLMLGIMLSRPIASLLTDLISPSAVFFLSAIVMTLLLIQLTRLMPERKPETNGLKYQLLILSMKDLLFNTQILRRRAIYQSLMFAAFCLFWTVVPLHLMQNFQFTQSQIALFALIGVAGAVVAPLAGKMADKGHSRKATLIAFISAAVAFAVSYFLTSGSWVTLVLLALTANLLDAGVSAHLVLGQRAIFSIDPKSQSRLNGLYIAIIFVGGAFGSGVGAWLYTHGGWASTSIAGSLLSLTALFLLLTEGIFGYKENLSLAK